MKNMMYKEMTIMIENIKLQHMLHGITVVIVLFIQLSLPEKTRRHTRIIEENPIIIEENPRVGGSTSDNIKLNPLSVQKSKSNP